MAWTGGLAEWTEGDTAFISVAFSYDLPKAYQRAIWFKSQGFKVRAGGPGMFAPSLRKYLADVAELGGEVDALIHHNPDATIASRGCPVGCYFCIVPKMEGLEFTLLPEFTPRPILCDNNLSALPVDYQEYIIEKYQKSGVPLLDANSGFEPITFDEGTYRRWKVINKGAWRFAYDETKEGNDVYRVSQILKDEPASTKRVYVLIGNEPFEACYRRIMQVIEWGCEPHVQPLIALNSLERKPIVRLDWTEQKLKDLARWSNRWLWRSVPFEDYNRHLTKRAPDSPSAVGSQGLFPLPMFFEADDPSAKSASG
jgi:hypothetical protein